MELEPLPLLEAQRSIYALPPGLGRFQTYLNVMRQGTDDIVLPLSQMNPMGKGHVAELAHQLIAFAAEDVVAGVCAELRPRLVRLDADLQVGLVLIDDAAGGWTNRFLTDATERFKNEADVKRGWSVVFVWTGETWDADKVKLETRRAVYRSLYKLRHGLPKTLRQMMRQEGLAAYFASAETQLSQEDLRRSRKIISAQLETKHYPTAFACFYGDAGALAAGYPALKLPEMAGLEVALVDTFEDRAEPEKYL